MNITRKAVLYVAVVPASHLMLTSLYNVPVSAVCPDAAGCHKSNKSFEFTVDLA